jgi:hypothetical protein
MDSEDLVHLYYRDYYSAAQQDTHQSTLTYGIKTLSADVL